MLGSKEKQGPLVMTGQGTLYLYAIVCIVCNLPYICDESGLLDRTGVSQGFYASRAYVTKGLVP